MRKICSILLVLTITLLAFVSINVPTYADTDIYEENGFFYKISQDNTATIIDFPWEESITIPDTLGNCTVTEIDSMTLLPACTVSLVIPDSVHLINSSMFYSAYQLREISLKPGNTAYTVDRDGILFNHDKTELICYPAGKEDNIYSVPEGVVKIADYAFSECLNLKEIFLPASLESVSETAFELCHNLQSFSVSANNPYFSSVDGVLFNKLQTVLYFYPCSKPATIYYVPNTVTRFAEGAFSYATLWLDNSDDDVKRASLTLTTLFIPSSVQVFSNPFTYSSSDFFSGYVYPIETLTVHCTPDSPLKFYCQEKKLAFFEWNGNVPLNPSDSNYTEPETAPKDINFTNEVTEVNIPNTFGEAQGITPSVVAMLAFSVVVALYRKKTVDR